MSDASPDEPMPVTPPSIGKLALALSKFQGKMPTVPKSKTANVRTKDGGSYSYKYADLADVSAAAMPLLAEQGLAFIAIPEESAKGFILRGLLVHESGETIEGFLPIYGSDNQTIGGSLSYGRRYLLGALTGIVTDDDTDAQGVGDEQAKPAPARRQSKTPPKQEAPADPVQADPSWIDKIATADTFDELTVVYNEADSLNVFGHLVTVTSEKGIEIFGKPLEGETLKAALFARRAVLTEKGAQ
jgi:hypothetical protein